MREILLTSSVLILGLLILRRVFREKISRRVQYALWALVLVRLLTPVSLPPLDISVLTMAEPARETISARLEAPAAPAAGPASQTFGPVSGAEEPAVSAAKPVGSPAVSPARGTGAAPAKVWTLTEILGAVWLAGAAGMGLWLVWSNLAFAARLRKYRMGMEIPSCKYPVYMMESELDSPCLFGILRPAVYLTPAAIRSEESLRHVLAHEETHARHLDPLWSLLRSVCLVVYWFDPLVWIAVSASRTDCELACDEGAVRTLGEEERLAYGKTLLSLIPVRRMPVNPLLSVTPMSSDKKRLRERIARIAEDRKTKKLALCAMSLLTAAVCVFTFAGCAEQAGRAAVPPSVPDAAPAAPSELDAPSAVNETEEGLLAAIPLADRECVKPYKLNNTIYRGDRKEILSGPGMSAMVGDRSVVCYRSQYGGDYVAEVVEDSESTWRAKHIASAIDDDSFHIESFKDVLGWDGIIEHYSGVLNEPGLTYYSVDEYGNWHTTECADDSSRSYYGVDENGDWYSLIHIPGRGMDCQSIDLDGDGVTELLCTDNASRAVIVFQRNGMIYSENITALLKEALPEEELLAYTGIDPYDRCLIALTAQGQGGETIEAARSICFDGENLLVYQRDQAASTGVYPAEKPVLTIPLEDQESSRPYRYQLKNIHTRDCAELFTGSGQSVELDGRRIQGYRSIDGYAYVAEVLSSDPDPWKAEVIDTVWDEDFTIVPFDQLFGWSGFSVHEAEYQTYYGFDDEDGVVNRLITVPGPGVEAQIVDLNGDGINELVCTNEHKAAYIYFQRDGSILSEDVALLMKEAVPDKSEYDFQFAGFDPDTRCLTMEAVPPEDGGSPVSAWEVYFGKENLFVYKLSAAAAD